MRYLAQVGAAAQVGLHHAQHHFLSQVAQRLNQCRFVIRIGTGGQQGLQTLAHDSRGQAGGLHTLLQFRSCLQQTHGVM